jgi:hypothetical protein
MIFSDTQRRSAPWSLRARLAASPGRLPALCRRARVLAAFLILFLLGLAITAVVPAARAGSPFRVGVARRDITPLEPVPMWGYGARHDALSTGVLDRLYATALVMQAGDKKLAIVGLDLGRSPSERSLQRIRARIKSEAAIDYSLIAGSHTHHGPVLELTDEPGKGKVRCRDSVLSATGRRDSCRDCRGRLWTDSSKNWNRLDTTARFQQEQTYSCRAESERPGAFSHPL